MLPSSPAFKKKILAALRVKGADLSLELVSNAEMEKLRRALMARRDFRGKEARKIAREEMVNVLSFPEPADFPHPELAKMKGKSARWLGEVYVNRAAPKREQPFLAVHGVLHLLGYRHEGLRDTMSMEALEKRVCRALGVTHGIQAPP